MKKKGFTLIELLAVIIILGILMLIAIPSVSGYITSSRKNAYADTIHKVVDGAIIKVNDGDYDITDPDTTYYVHVKNIDLENGSLKSPYGDIEDAYVVVTYDGDEYSYYYVGKDEADKGIKTLTLSENIDNQDITDVTSINTGIGVGSRSKIIVYDAQGNVTSVDKTGSVPETGNKGMSTAENDCTFDGQLVRGAEYVNGQFTYRYEQWNLYGEWKDSGYSDFYYMDGGWGVILTDKDSTAPVTTKVCTSINGKPILSMDSMFYNSKTTSIDLSSFNTKNVTGMVGMFRNATNLTTLDVRPLNTSKVWDMTYMFAGCTNLQSLDLKNFDTSSTLRFYSMFENCTGLTTLDLSNFNLSSATGFYSMIQGCSNIKRLYMDNWDVSHIENSMLSGIFYVMTNLEYLSMKNWKIGQTAPPIGYLMGAAGLRNLKTLDVSGWNLSNTTSLYAVFQSLEDVETIVGINTWNLSNVTNIAQMFLLCKKLKAVDFSEVDLSHVTNTTDMFDRCNSLTTGYAKTQADADKLNSSSKKPEGVTFTVK